MPPPENPSDGEVVYEGSGLSATDSHGRKHGIAWYAFYGRKPDASYSKGVRLSAPLGTSSFVRNWLVLGPFEPPDQTLTSAYESEFIGEENAIPEVKTGNKIGNCAWEIVPYSSMGGDFVDFHSIFKGRFEKPVQVGYLHTYLWAEEDIECRMLIGVDDGYRIWLNKEYIAGLNRGGVPLKDDFSIPVKLKKGWNSLLVKVTEAGGNWMFCARFVLPDGSPPNVRIRNSREKSNHVGKH